MTHPEIQLKRDPTCGLECVVGIGDEVIPDDRIIAAVAAHGRLFPYVVMHLAINQHRKEFPDYVHNHDAPAGPDLQEIMRGIRDDLVIGINALPQEVVE